ncbi:asparaginase [Actinocrinis puniceicyclus]|uniref:Asparaginase n=1 Tax=Actinocrinis puniceicyclus TaxID=977794 RepID=A0A8J7WHI4_9ACTN|nr:asparaginase [Actinocrinis puniceicyclus]MBS2962308.1 asparaginase [Actinocrinis puniceicyclus]
MPAPSERPFPVEPVLAEIVRCDFVEGVHRGRLVLLDADGSVRYAVGDISAPLLPRSSNKPMQATGLLDAGLELAGPELALAAASHAGEPFHVDGVRKILAGAGLDESALRTAPTLPLDDDARHAELFAGATPRPIFSDCSGKHAAMLAVCVRNGWDVAGYLDPAHPVQRSIRAAVERLAGEQIAYDAVDGCGAPLLGLSLTGLARAVQACVTAEPRSNARKVADTMRAHPEYVAGTQQLDTLAMRAVPGLLAKSGAEAVHAAALPDGRALAFKISDGSKRAKPVLLAEALRRLGVRSEALDRLGTVALYGGSDVVGEVRAAF